MRTPVIWIIALLSLTMPSYGAEQAIQQQPAQVPDVDDTETIVITGQQRDELRRLMLDFIVEIGDPPRGRGYARYRDKVCVSVANIPNSDTAQYVVDRISVVAQEVGLEAGEPGCRPNLEIIFVSDGRQAVEWLMANSPNMFDPFHGAGGTNQGEVALEEFRTSEAPVRWWQITMVFDERGNTAINLNDGPRLQPNGRFSSEPWVQSSGSRISSRVSDALWNTFVIVDTSKLGAATWPQITDYLAMVSLGQVDPGGIPANHDSILNLFSAGNHSSGMTELDHTYLRALYTTDMMQMPDFQRGLLADTMLRVREKTAE